MDTAQLQPGCLTGFRLWVQFLVPHTNQEVIDSSELEVAKWGGANGLTTKPFPNLHNSLGLSFHTHQTERTIHPGRGVPEGACQNKGGVAACSSWTSAAQSHRPSTLTHSLNCGSSNPSPYNGSEEVPLSSTTAIAWAGEA